MSDRYFCPCCGYRGLDEEPPGSFDICDICGWEDDYVQFKDHDYEGGANSLSLRQWQYNFLNGLSKSGDMPTEERNPEWVQLSPPKHKAKKVKANFIVGSDNVAKNNT